MADPAHILRARTPRAWFDLAAGRTDELLLDHANCEKKAASTALALMFAYPEDFELASRMSNLAREELRHFELVQQKLTELGVSFRRLSPSRYAEGLRKVLRRDEPGRRIDLLLCGALIECRRRSPNSTHRSLRRNRGTRGCTSALPRAVASTSRRDSVNWPTSRRNSPRRRIRSFAFTPVRPSRVVAPIREPEAAAETTAVRTPGVRRGAYRGNARNSNPPADTSSTLPCVYQSPSTMRRAGAPSISSGCTAGR